jgi:hypothetical protein
MMKKKERDRARLLSFILALGAMLTVLPEKSSLIE